MAETVGSVDVAKMAKDISVVVNVSGLRRFQIRLALGAWLIRLGSWIVGFGPMELRQK